jgi:hypothetical protein
VAIRSVHRISGHILTQGIEVATPRLEALIAADTAHTTVQHQPAVVERVLRVANTIYGITVASRHKVVRESIWQLGKLRRIWHCRTVHAMFFAHPKHANILE